MIPFVQQIKRYEPVFLELKYDYWVYWSGFKYNRGRVFIETSPNHFQCIATPREKTLGSMSYIVKDLRSKGYLKEIDIKNRPDLWPHIEKHTWKIIGELDFRGLEKLIERIS